MALLLQLIRPVSKEIRDCAVEVLVVVIAMFLNVLPVILVVAAVATVIWKPRKMGVPV